MLITHTDNFEKSCNFTYAPCDEIGGILPHLWVYVLPEPHETGIRNLCGWLRCGDFCIEIPTNARVFDVAEEIRAGLNTSAPTQILGALDPCDIKVQADDNLPCLDVPYCGHIVMYPHDREKFASFQRKERGVSRFPFDILGDFCDISYKESFET